MSFIPDGYVRLEAGLNLLGRGLFKTWADLELITPSVPRPEARAKELDEEVWPFVVEACNAMDDEGLGVQDFLACRKPYREFENEFLAKIEERYRSGGKWNERKVERWMTLHPQSDEYKQFFDLWYRRERFFERIRPKFFAGELGIWYLDQGGNIQGVPSRIFGTDEWNLLVAATKEADWKLPNAGDAELLMRHDEIDAFVASRSRPSKDGEGKKSNPSRINADDPLIEEMHKLVQERKGRWEAANDLSKRAVTRDGQHPVSDKDFSSVISRLLRKYREKYGPAE